MPTLNALGTDNASSGIATARRASRERRASSRNAYTGAPGMGDAMVQSVRAIRGLLGKIAPKKGALIVHQTETAPPTPTPAYATEVSLGPPATPNSAQTTAPAQPMATASKGSVSALLGFRAVTAQS